MKPAYVNDYAAAKLFFDGFNIPYEIVTRGENKGMLRVKPIREKDRVNQFKATRQLKDAGFDDLVDHRNCFRDADDNTVCTFSPYTAKRLPENAPEWLRMSEHSIYGMWTKTFVVVVTNE